MLKLLLSSADYNNQLEGRLLVRSLKGYELVEHQSGLKVRPPIATI